MPEEDRDGSLQGEWVQKKAQRRLSAFLPLRWTDAPEEDRHKARQGLGETTCFKPRSIKSLLERSEEGYAVPGTEAPGQQSHVGDSLYLSGEVCTCRRNRDEILRDSVLSRTRAGPPAGGTDIMN